MTSVIPRTQARTLLVLYTGILLYMSLTPEGGTGASGFGINLLIMHAAAYLVLGVLTIYSFPGIAQNSRLSILFYVALFGFGTEILQTTVPGRFFSWTDIGMNTLGAAVVLIEPELRETVTAVAQNI